MKTLCLLFVVVFLVFQVQANPTLPPVGDVEPGKVPEVPSYQEDDHSLPRKKAATSRFTTFACNGNFGYCLPRDWQCFSGLVYKEAFNDCPLPDIFKCCL